MILDRGWRILDGGIIVIFDDSIILKFRQGLGPKEVSLGKALSMTIQLLRLIEINLSKVIGQTSS